MKGNKSRGNRYKIPAARCCYCIVRLIANREIEIVEEHTRKKMLNVMSELGKGKIEAVRRSFDKQYENRVVFAKHAPIHVLFLIP